MPCHTRLTIPSHTIPYKANHTIPYHTIPHHTTYPTEQNQIELYLLILQPSNLFETKFKYCWCKNIFDYLHFTNNIRSFYAFTSHLSGSEKIPHCLLVSSKWKRIPSPKESKRRWWIARVVLPSHQTSVSDQTFDTATTGAKASEHKSSQKVMSMALACWRNHWTQLDGPPKWSHLYFWFQGSAKCELLFDFQYGLHVWRWKSHI